MWKLVKGNEAGTRFNQAPYNVEYLDDNQQVIPFATESYGDLDTALARAKFVNENGTNVRVSLEIAFCINI